MALYTSYDTSMYYDTPKKQPQTPPIKQEVQNKPYTSNIVTPPINTKKSLYEAAVEAATAKEAYNGPDFRKVYRVGQRVAIQSPNGQFKTKNGRIAEIVAANLMYVFMEDSYKDSTDQWLADFVTDQDTIHLI